MPDTTLRQLTMLSLIPGRPGKITSRELHSRLKSQGYDVSVRTIERDLPKLSDAFPLTCDEGRPAGWSWEAKDMRVTFPRMDERTALTYELLSRYLAPVLPRSMLKHLEADFGQARTVLNQLRGSPLGRWSKRIAVLPAGQQLLSAEIRQDVNDVVYDALLHGRRFEAEYRSLEIEDWSRYPFNPLGLLYREGVLYLIATLFDYVDVRHYALHRMRNAKALSDPANPIKGFDFESYVRDEQSVNMGSGKTISLELVVVKWLARHLGERRLSTDQVIAPVQGDNKRYLVTATVADTDPLFWWLCSLGPDAEILKPVALRHKMTNLVSTLADVYL